MQKETISARNLASIFMLMILCSMIMSGAVTSMHDTWVAFLLLIPLYFPIALMLGRIAKLFPGRNLIEIIQIVGGKAFSTITIGVLTFYVLSVASFVLRNFVEFSVVISLNNTPRLVLMIVLAAVSLYLASKGLDLIGRWSLVSVILITANLILVGAISLNIMDFSHLLPFLESTPANLLENGFMIGSIAAGESIIILACITNFKKNENPYKGYIWGLVLGVLITTLTVLRNQAILGPPLAGAAKFTSYAAMRIIRKGNFLERIESIVLFNLFIMGVTKIAVSLFAGARSLSVLAKEKEYKHMLAPALFIVLALCSISFKNMQDMFNFAWVYVYFSVPMQFIIPLIVLIKSEIYVRSSKTLTKHEEENLLS